MLFWNGSPKTYLAKGSEQQHLNQSIKSLIIIPDFKAPTLRCGTIPAKAAVNRTLCILWTIFQYQISYAVYGKHFTTQQLFTTQQSIYQTVTQKKTDECSLPHNVDTD